MILNINKLYFLLLIVSITHLMGCKKYLEKKSNQSLIVPTTVQDLQSLLDNPNLSINDPGALEMSADDYYLSNSAWSGMNEYLRRMYTWDVEKQFAPGNNNDWANAYNKIYITNVVLDNLSKIDRISGDEADWSNAKGNALFLRAKMFTQLIWTWGEAYDQNTATTDLGIPLRLDPNFNNKSVRASVEETYFQILKDLKESVELLPGIPSHVVRASKPAAYAWLARVYLSMRNYDSAFVYADKCLKIKNNLINYNNLNASGNPPIASYNNEVIYHSIPSQAIAPPCDTVLYSSYDNNDLRKSIFFKNNGTVFQGSYHGNGYSGFWFTGIATDEIYLIRAECNARKGDKDAALTDLNTLMVNRWKNNGSWVAFTAGSANEALAKILIERRKELVYRGLRWSDIKRLNKDGANIILKRNLNNTLYTLPSNDLRFALPLPEDVVSISGVQQNPR